jgi:hypothetical protein
MYFDSMREIRVQRKRITTEFGQRFTPASMRFTRRRRPRRSSSRLRCRRRQHDLVKNDDLEIAVAVAGIVSKVTSQFSLPVMQLTRRIFLCPTDRHGA